MLESSKSYIGYLNFNFKKIRKIKIKTTKQQKEVFMHVLVELYWAKAP